MLDDSDQRVVPAVLDALVKLKAPNAVTLLLDRLKADDPIIRSAAARGVGELKPPNGAAALAEPTGSACATRNMAHAPLHWRHSLATALRMR